MSEDLFPPEHENAEEPLSADDLAILQAFDAMDTWQHTDTPVSPLSQSQDAEFTDEDMLLLFVTEVDEDIGQMRRALSQLEEDDTLNVTQVTALRRIAHKIRGAAGAMECHAIASIARHIEDVATQIMNRSLLPLVGLNVLVQAVLALEVTLQDFLTQGQESDAPLLMLEHELEQLTIALQFPQEGANPTTTPLAKPSPLILEEEDTSPDDEQDTQAYPPLPASISIEAQRFERLLCQAELLAEARTPLENAQKQVEVALGELHTAQGRLQRLERSLIGLALPLHTPRSISRLPASSLVERMLKEATPRSSILRKRTLEQRLHLSKVHEKGEWDELEFERYNERDRTVLALRDAMAQVTVANTHVQRTYAHLSEVTQHYMQRATDVHTHLHLLRLTPLSVLLPRLQRVLTKHAPHVLFEVVGETTEIDQDILDTLAAPLATLIRTCITNTHSSDEESVSEARRVWLRASALGNEVTLEIGFSMTVQGGALDVVQPFVQQVGGTVVLQRNTEDNVSFFLRFPRSQGTVRGLLVRVGDQYVVIPFSHVQRVSDEQHEKPDIVYHLYKLLNFPYEPDIHHRVTPIIMLPQGHSRLTTGILVDEVVSDVNVIVKPLASYLQRPGIAGTVLDGKGHVLLLLDIPALLRHYYTRVRHHTLPEDNKAVKISKTQHLALIADDSMLLRKSLVRTLEDAHYDTIEASDGLEALDLLTQNPPDVFLLDMEMPNLNGSDLLSIMHIYPELHDVKIIILTSRATEKYKQHALELGAHAYLTKPCPSDVLLETIEGLLQ